MNLETKVAIWVGVAIIALAIAGFEILGLAEPWWHTISYYSQHNKVFFWLIFLFFCLLPLWWIYHIWYTVIPKL